VLKWLNLAALLALVAGVWLEVVYWKQKRRYRLIRYERSMRLLATATGLGAMVFTASWPLDPETRILGFPFTSAVFELHGGIWVDYAGAVTIPAMIANVIFWALLPQLPITFLALREARKKRNPNESVQPTA
jgi:hypothetical protein